MQTTYNFVSIDLDLNIVNASSLLLRANPIIVDDHLYFFKLLKKRSISAADPYLKIRLAVWHAILAIVPGHCVATGALVAKVGAIKLITVRISSAAAGSRS
jgi:hypothetical protein